MQFNIPQKILIVLQQLEQAGYEAFLVGGCVRDLIRGQEPKDWDITTNAKPEQILEVFLDGKYENDFGTVILPEKYIQVEDRISNKLQILSDNIRINERTKNKITQIAKKYLQKIKCPAHGLQHAKDIVINALKIAEDYPAVNKELLESLCWLHDSGRAVDSSEEHIENSQKIVKKELEQYLKKEDVQKISQAIEHSSKNRSIFLEQQILKEADIIDGLNTQRINSYSTEKEKKIHLQWLKDKFKNNKIYQTFITDKGKKLLKEAVEKFNQESFPVDVEIPDWSNIGNVEITTYRIESTYSDRRRPDEVKFAKTLEEDLGRRDFTCNAMALQVESQAREEVVPRGGAIGSEADNRDGRGATSRSADSIENHEPQIINPKPKIIDLFNGQQDIKNKVIRAVGDANERFNEDALRMIRAVRFAAQLSEGDDLEFLKNRKGEGRQNQKTEYQVLAHKEQGTRNKIQTNSKYQETISKQLNTKIDLEQREENGKQNNNKEKKTIQNLKLSHLKLNENLKFKIENSVAQQRWWVGENTFTAIKKNAHLLKHISPERISDEFQKIILSNRPAWGIELLVEAGLMEFIIPEVLDTIGVRQNRHHYYGPFNTVYKHMLAALKSCPSKKLEVRLAAFFHDIGKPKSKRGHGYNSTFYGHEYIGARITKQVMERLKFPRKVIDKTVLLVKNHMFYYNTDEVGEKGVRKVVRKVGLENINDLIDVRIGDRLGSGVAKAVPYKLRHFKYMVEKVSKDPISVKDLKINGDILLADYNFKPGPQMGAILEILLAEVLDDPKKNTLEYLADRALELQKENLQQLRQIAKDKIKEEKQKEEQQTKGKYWVK